MPVHHLTLPFMLTLLVATLTSSILWAQDSPPAAPSAAALFQQAQAIENGEGVPRNPLLAATIYCQAARMGAPDAQYNLGWMYANGRGVARDDAIAAFFFRAAAQQGLEVAQRMLKVVGAPMADTPDCMRDDPPPVHEPATVATSGPRTDYKTIAPRKIFDLVHKLAPQFKVEPQLALSIIAAESNFDAQAISVKNAQGLMQLIPETSERFKVKNAFDPAQNIRGGLTYLRWLLAYFEGNVALVAAAYNAGEGTVDKYLGVPPFAETRSYVQRILRTFGDAEHPFDKQVVIPSQRLKLIK